MSKFLIGLALVIAIAGAYAVGFKYPEIPANFGSPIGTTFQTQKAPAITFSPTTGTSTSIQNNTGSDQYVMKNQIVCTNIGTSRTAFTGAALASLTLTLATSSTGTGVVPIVNPILLNFTVPTTSPIFLMGSSTTDTASSSAIDWTAGSWLMWGFNATNTAVCTLGVQTLGS